MKDFIPSSLAVMRTPLLPADEVDAWSANLRAPRADDAELENAIAEDRVLLRTRLQSMLARPEIAEAIFLASPTLMESIDAWRRDPESKKGRRTEQGLVRYFLRMATRPTPFGLFSGCTAGRVGEQTRLSLAPRADYRRHSRLDMDYLFALCEHLGRNPEVRAELRFRPNSSLYEAGGRLRLAESRVNGRMRTYHFVAIDAFDALRETLQRAANGARLRELAEALVASDPEGEITFDAAEAFLHDVVDNQLLLPELALPVTGEESTVGLLRQLDDLPSAGDVRTRLEHADLALSQIDEAGIGTPPQRYLDLAHELEPLGVPVEMSRLFQVDLMKPASEVVVGETVIAELLRCVEQLHRISRARFERSLEEFRNAFEDRYGSDREMPLLDVLDEESGIGFERSGSAGAEASPLLSGLSFQRRGNAMSQSWGNQESVLLEIFTRALSEGRTEVVLSEEELKLLENPDRPPMPDAFQAMTTIAAASTEAIERGEFRLMFHGAMGPSGARMLGRFCHVDEAIREGVEQHLAAEEALHPDALFAEIVHLPAGRLGNILARPVLREYEIPYLGRSGAPREKQIALDDLLVTVAGGQIRLRSRSLDREVIPRLSTAHNTMSESLGVYRFLAALQGSVNVHWNWGPLESAPFLPRVVCGRVVVSRARWRIGANEISPIASASGAARYRLVQRFREQHRMPRHIVLTDADNELFIDFENALALDAVIELIRNRPEVTLTELFPAPDELCAEGPEGRFYHELIVPFTRRPVPIAPMFSDVKAPAISIARTFPPGSEWLYAKLYTGTATADRVLTEELAPLAADAIANGHAQRWFFIRYSDPNWHLRVRFHGDPFLLREHVQPALEAMGRRLFETGAVWKLQFDTYEREVERYGGPEAIELAEELFYRDSESVVALLQSISGDAGSDLRWRLMLAGIDRLLADFDFDLDARIRLAESVRDNFARQFNFDKLRDQLADRFRRDRPTLQRLLDDDAGIPALEQRSDTIRGIARELLALERRGRLQLSVNAIVSSLIHMFVNRLSRSAGPEHELVLYDYLVQLYRSRLARRSAIANVQSKAM